MAPSPAWAPRSARASAVLHGAGCFLHGKDFDLSQWALLHGIKAMLHYSSLLFSITNYKNKRGH